MALVMKGCELLKIQPIKPGAANMLVKLNGWCRNFNKADGVQYRFPKSAFHGYLA